MADRMGWEDLEAEASESLLDDRLRLELERSLPVDERPEDVLAALAPAMSQAKRKRMFGQIASGIAASALVFVGIGVAVQAVPDSDRNQTVAGEPDASTVDNSRLTQPAEDQDAEEPAKETLEVADSTLPPDPATSQPGNPEDRNASPDTTERQVPLPTADPPATSSTLTAGPNESSNTEPTPVPGPEPTPPNPTTVPSTSPSVTPTTLAAGTAINSDCGSILVSTDGDDNIMLLDVDPRTGYSVDIKSAGPESIEVAFSSPDKECEVKAKVEDGELEIEGGEE